MYSFTNGQDATYVIGQSDFVSNSSGCNATRLNTPRDIAIDAIHGKLYVADYNNNRVLRFSYPIHANQPAAELVFGQPNFVSSAGGVAQNRLNLPMGLFVDSSGRLWVADRNNNRVLYFNNAHLIAVNQPNADRVLGQANFTTNAPATTQNGMDGPYDITIDSTGTLFVADRTNNRVLRFNNAATKANGANADGVLGQPDFTSFANHLTQNGMNSPRGVTIGNGILFVSDRSNSRVLRFDNAATKANGANADRVLGQPDFTSNASHLTQNGMDFPSRVCLDNTSNRLFVSDGFSFDRVVIFNSVFSKPNYANADNVIGQPDFTTSGNATAINRLSMESSGGGVAFDSVNNVFIVADDNNNRLMYFIDRSPQSIPTLSEWGMIIFTFFLGAIAIYSIRKKQAVV